jgi:hypothetical protein
VTDQATLVPEAPPAEAVSRPRPSAVDRGTMTDGTHESAPRQFFALERSVVRALVGPVVVVVQTIPNAPAWVCPPGT